MVRPDIIQLLAEARWVGYAPRDYDQLRRLGSRPALVTLVVDAIYTYIILFQPTGFGWRGNSSWFSFATHIESPTQNTQGGATHASVWAQLHHCNEMPHVQAITCLLHAFISSLMRNCSN